MLNVSTINDECFCFYRNAVETTRALSLHYAARQKKNNAKCVVFFVSKSTFPKFWNFGKVCTTH